MRVTEPRSRRVLARLALVAAPCVMLAALAGGWRRLEVRETGEAHAYVEAGQRALAKGAHGDAVLSFERARVVAPRAAFVRSALGTGDVKEIDPAVRRVFGWVTAVEWLAIGTTSAWVTGLGVAFLLLRRKSLHGSGARWLSLAAASAFVVALCGLMESSASPLAVVTGNEARVLVAPYSTAALEVSLPSGSLVRVGPTFADFSRVELGDGTTGWVARPSIDTVTASGG